MEETGRSLKFPTRDQLVQLNRRHLELSREEFIEPDNLRSPDSVGWVLDAIQYPLFGVDHYPTLVDKAVQLVWIIIHGHVFHDGNKRTGMSALEAILRLNNYRLEATDQEIEEIALRVAQGTEHCSREEFNQWLRDRLVIAH